MIGRVISGRYTVESLIGSGGMANVYKAHDNMLNRTVALKVLKEEHRGDMEFVRRFEREARAVLSLSHENIVRSYAVGEDGDISYIELEGCRKYNVSGARCAVPCAPEGNNTPRC